MNIVRIVPATFCGACELGCTRQCCCPLCPSQSRDLAVELYPVVKVGLGQRRASTYVDPTTMSRSAHGDADLWTEIVHILDIPVLSSVYADMIEGVNRQARAVLV